MPDAGKSSLLGALAQAAQTQEHVLNGRLVDLSRGLAELQQRLYEERPRETLEEVTPYPVRLEPFTSREPSATATPIDAVLVDCDGRVANELLGEEHPVEPEQGDRALSKAILNADTLVLVVDASADPGTVERDFGQFTRFLRHLEHDRGRRSDIGGLPVYLVLTKCDLLAKKGDTTRSWMESIEERKRQVDARFQEFLARQAEEDLVPFGQIDLHLWATAVKRPALADAPAKPREPYGVAELFRQCFESAQEFRESWQRASRRLNLTVGSAVAVLVLLLFLAAFLVLNRARPEVKELEEKIEQFRMKAGTSATQRLKEPLRDTTARLHDFESNPEFSRIAPELHKYVTDYLAEAEAYEKYTRKIEEAARHRLSAVQTDEELKEIQDRLEGLAPPAPYESAWADTVAVRLRNGWLADARALRKAIDQEESWFREETRKGKQLYKRGAKFLVDDTVKPEVKQRWQEDVRNYLAIGPLHTKEEPVREVPSLTYRTVLEFSRVKDAQREWQKARKELADLSKLVAGSG
jgi:hypothetical protein